MDERHNISQTNTWPRGQRVLAVIERAEATSGPRVTDKTDQSVEARIRHNHHISTLEVLFYHTNPNKELSVIWMRVSHHVTLTCREVTGWKVTDMTRHVVHVRACTALLCVSRTGWTTEHETQWVSFNGRQSWVPILSSLLGEKNIFWKNTWRYSIIHIHKYPWRVWGIRLYST